MSSFSIGQTLLVTRWTMAGSSPFSQSQIWLGTICHRRPNLSLSHPQTLASPPSVRPVRLAPSFSQE